jgi:hypothetical protein
LFSNVFLSRNDSRIFQQAHRHFKSTLKRFFFFFKSNYFESRKYMDFAKTARGFHVIETQNFPCLKYVWPHPNWTYDMVSPLSRSHVVRFQTALLQLSLKYSGRVFQTALLTNSGRAFDSSPGIFKRQCLLQPTLDHRCSMGTFIC